MNELLFIAIGLTALSLVLVALRIGPNWLYGLVATYLIIANLFAAKLSIVFGVVSSLSIPIYAAVFLATDAAAEHFGRRFAHRMVWIGFGAQLSLAAFGQLITMGEPFGDPALSDALSTVFGFVPRIVHGSFIAYLVSMHVDVRFYDYLKRRFERKYLWLRNNGSTIVSQTIDSAIFLGIAFYGVIPNLFEFFLSVLAVKLVVALFDTPFLYLSGVVVDRYGHRPRYDVDSESGYVCDSNEGR